MNWHRYPAMAGVILIINDNESQSAEAGTLFSVLVSPCDDVTALLIPLLFLFFAISQRGCSKHATLELSNMSGNACYRHQSP